MIEAEMSKVVPELIASDTTVVVAEGASFQDQNVSS